jgi:hypothetical protein
MDPISLIPQTKSIAKLVSKADLSKPASRIVHTEPLGSWEKNTKKTCDITRALVDDDFNVDMRFRVRWHSPKQEVPFAHTSVIGEIWKPIKNMDIAWTASGQAWDKRSLILHPAVAGLSITDAGFDQAYLSALSASHQLMGQAQRSEFTQGSRDHMGVMLRESFSPFRLFMRGAAAWCALAMSGSNQTQGVPIVAGVHVREARPLWGPNQFNAALYNHSNSPCDVIFIRIDDRSEAGILAAATALTADKFPFRSHRKGVGAMWPTMGAPMLYYSSDNQILATRAPVSREDMWRCLARLADTYDAWDLLLEAFQTVATMMNRPEGMATWMGRDRFVWNLPQSNLKAGILGPLFNGVSSEGLHSPSFPEPSLKCLLVEGCLRATYLLSAAAVHLSHYVDTHYAFKGLDDVDKSLLASLASITYTRAFNDDCGTICGQLGWEGAMGRSLRDLRVTTGGRGVKAFLDTTQYASMACLLPWTDALAAESSVSAILRPAVPTIPGALQGWQRVTNIGIVSAQQIASAIMHLPVSTRFLVVTRKGRRRYIPGPSQLGFNRAAPLLAPKVMRSDVTIATHVLVGDAAKYLQAVEHCKMLNQAHIVVDKMLADFPDADFGYEDRESDSGDGPGYVEVEEREDSEFGEMERAAAAAADGTDDDEWHPPGTGITHPIPVPLADSARLLSELTGLDIGAYPLRSSTLPISDPERGQHAANWYGMRSALKSKTPAEVIEAVPIALRRDVALKMCDFIRNVMPAAPGHGELSELRSLLGAYTAQASAMEISPAVTPEEEEQRELLSSRGEAPHPTAVQQAVAHAVQGEHAAAAARLTQEDAARQPTSWADEMEALNPQDFQRASSGKDSSIQDSGTVLVPTSAESVTQISAPATGEIGFSAQPI